MLYLGNIDAENPGKDDFGWIQWIMEFIPLPAISGFMTRSALKITVGQALSE
jgi:hypothetical protein